MQLFTAAAIQAGPKNGRAMVDWMKSGVTVSTAIGELKFDQTGEVQPQRFVWYVWRQGEFAAETTQN